MKSQGWLSPTLGAWCAAVSTRVSTSSAMGSGRNPLRTSRRPATTWYSASTTAAGSAGATGGLTPAGCPPAGCPPLALPARCARSPAALPARPEQVLILSHAFLLPCTACTPCAMAAAMSSAALPTSRDSRTARVMSGAAGGSPSPSSPRCSARPW